jgi:hypothetical protein
MMSVLKKEPKFIEQAESPVEMTQEGTGRDSARMLPAAYVQALYQPSRHGHFEFGSY